MTVGARLYRVEQQLSIMDKKIDQIIHGINIITHTPKPVLPQTLSQQPLIIPSSSKQSFQQPCLEDDV